LSIFAVDVQHSGLRFATGGADSKVRIWALAPLLEEVAATTSSDKENPFAENNNANDNGGASTSPPPSTPRLLATLSDHLQSVNAVRFAPCGSGNRLATGADDGTACVFELRGPAAVGLIPVLDRPTTLSGRDRPLVASPSQPAAAAAAAAAAALAASRPHARAPVLPGTAFLGGAPPSIEQWKLVCPLRAHANNVTDLSWSPDGSLLATASLDNTVVVWETTPGTPSIKIVATLKGHESYVKGVAFDPLGKYLASQSDDASVLVWRTDDWQPAARVTSPFSGGYVSSSFSTRLSWAPDGTFLTACNAIDARAGVHMAPLVSRGKSWANDHSLVGHSGPVVASRASGKLFVPCSSSKKKEKKSSPPDPREVGRAVALGALDGKVSVWLTTKPTAVAVAARFFKQMVVDLAWTPDGYSLLAVSSDGTLACLQFEESELGEALGEEEAQALRRRLFGDERARNARFAETAGQLLLEQGGGGGGVAAAAAAAPSASDRFAARLAPANGTIGTLPAAAGAEAAAPLRKAAAASAAPAMMMPPPPPMPRALLAPPSSTAGGGGGVTILAPPPAPPQQDLGSQRLSKRQRHAAAPSWLLPPPPLASRVAAPVPSDDDERFSSAASSSSNPFATRSGGIIEAVNALGPPMRPDAPPRATATVALTRVFSNGTAPKRAWEDLVPGGVSQLVASRRFAAAATGGSPLEGGGALLLWSRAGRRLAPPLSLSAPIVHLATDDDDDDGDGGGGSGGGSNKSRSKKEQKEQQQQQRGWKLLAITADGGVHCWDVRARSLTLRTSLVPLLAVASASAAGAAAAAAAAAATLTTADAAAAAAVAPPSTSTSSSTPVGLVSARLCRATGAPTVVLSDFSAAVFDMGLGGWARVADGVSANVSAAAALASASASDAGNAPSSALFAHSAFATSAAAPPPPPGMPSNAFGAPGELRSLQARAAASGGPAAVLAGAARLAGSSSSFPAASAAASAAAARSAAALDTRAHLESNVAAAAALGCGSEWREWTLAYVRYLTGDADEERLREVFEELLGPARLSSGSTAAASKKGGGGNAAAAAAAQSSSASWSPSLGGVDKRALLRDALAEASRNRAVQRTVAEFHSLLGFAA